MGGQHHHHSDMVERDDGVIDADFRYKEIKRATYVAIIINAILAVGKISFGLLGHSQALVADGVHSLADLASDIIVIVAAKEAAKEADEEHPYGHGRIETAVEVALGAILILVAIGIAYDAVSRIIHPDTLLHPGWLALFTAFVSIVCNEGLYQYTIRIAESIRSNMLKANAWHHRSDAISSVIAMIGIAGTLLGWSFLDAVAAIGVSLLISKVGWDIAWRSLRELIDTALEPHKVEEIRRLILQIDGVKAVHDLRTRSMGGYALVDVHILVINSKISVSEGHLISECVIRLLKKEIGEISDVTVHIDPEDDQRTKPSGHLPMRHELKLELESLFKSNPYYKLRKGMILHYLGGKVFVEIELPVSLIQSRESSKEIKQSFELKGDQKDYLGDIKVVFS